MKICVPPVVPPIVAPVRLDLSRETVPTRLAMAGSGLMVIVSVRGTAKGVWAPASDIAGRDVEAMPVETVSAPKTIV